MAKLLESPGIAGGLPLFNQTRCLQNCPTGGEIRFMPNTAGGVLKMTSKGGGVLRDPLLVNFKTPPAVLGMKRISPPAGQF